MTGQHIDVPIKKQFTREAFCIKVSKPVRQSGELTYRHIVFQTVFGNRFIWNRRESVHTGDPTPPLNVPLLVTGFVRRHTEDIEHHAVTFIERVTYATVERNEAPASDSH